MFFSANNTFNIVYHPLQKLDLKDLFTPSESEKDQRPSEKDQRLNCKHQ